MSFKIATMSKYRLLLFILFFPLLLHAQWKAYLSYYDPTEIVEGEGKTIYVLASGGLYSYDRTTKRRDSATAVSHTLAGHRRPKGWLSSTTTITSTCSHPTVRW